MSLSKYFHISSICQNAVQFFLEHPIYQHIVDNNISSSSSSSSSRSSSSNNNNNNTCNNNNNNGETSWCKPCVLK